MQTPIAAPIALKHSRHTESRAISPNVNFDSNARKRVIAEKFREKNFEGVVAGMAPDEAAKTLTVSRARRQGDQGG